MNAPPSAASAAPKEARFSESWVTLNNRATKLLNAGDLEGALELFERCVVGDASNAVFCANLAETLARLAQKQKSEHLARPRLHPAVVELKR